MHTSITLLLCQANMVWCKADLQVVQGEVEELILQAPHDRGGQALQGDLHVGALPPHHLHHPLQPHQHLHHTKLMKKERETSTPVGVGYGRPWIDQ